MAKKERIILIFTFLIMFIGFFMAFIDILLFMKAKSYQISIGDPSINYRYFQDAVVEIIVALGALATSIYVLNDYKKSVKMTNMLAFYRCCLKENILDLETSSNRVKASKIAKRFKYVEDFTDIKICYEDAKNLYEAIQEIRLVQSGQKEILAKLKEDSEMLQETSQYKDFVGADKRVAIYKDKEASHTGKTAITYKHMAELSAQKTVRTDLSTNFIFDHLSLSKITTQVTDAGSITVGVDVLPDEEIVMLESGETGVVDGTLIAELTVDGQALGSAYLVFPVDGLDNTKAHRLGGIAFDVGAKRGSAITVNIKPYRLWVMDK